MNWDEYQRADNTINLTYAWKHVHQIQGDGGKRHGNSLAFLKKAEKYQPISSRQIAALALAQADTLIPFKGEQSMSQPHAFSKIDVYPGTNKPIPGGVRLLRADTNYFKNQLARKLDIAPAEPGAWHLHADATDEWARHMCAEYVNEKGFWECPAGRPNHGWDCSVLNLVAADVLGIKFWNREGETGKKPRRKKEEWIRRRRGWVRGS